MTDSLDATSPPMPVLTDRYELRELIGQDGMAEVHRAHDRLLDRRVAVKVFLPRDDPVAQRRFDDEACALARLAHPGLVAIFDVGTVADRPFLVMEFVEGTSLRSHLLTGPLPLAQVLRIGGVLADALAHAHHRGVVHRDVKPSNILLDREGLPHLTDFGIALLAGSPRLTNVNEVLGTPAYPAPEQLSDTGIGPPADVYALGLTLLECLSGELECASGTCWEVAPTRLHQPPRLPTDVPPELRDLLIAMTAADAFDRPTAQTCARRLQATLDNAGSDVEPPQPVSMPLLADELFDRRAEQERTAHEPVGPGASARSGPRWPLIGASLAGIAAVITALVFLLAPQPLTGRSQAATAGRTSNGPSAGFSTNRVRATGGSEFSGSGTRGPVPTAGLVVANGHPAPTIVPTSPPAPTSATHGTARKGRTPPATPSSPPRTSVSTRPPTTTSSEPPTTVSSPTEPPSTSAAPGAASGP